MLDVRNRVGSLEEDDDLLGPRERGSVEDRAAAPRAHGGGQGSASRGRDRGALRPAHKGRLGAAGYPGPERESRRRRPPAADRTVAGGLGRELPLDLNSEAPAIGRCYKK